MTDVNTSTSPSSFVPFDKRRLGPRRTRQFLCILRKNLSSFPWYKCARWIFFPPNFVKFLPPNFHRCRRPALERDKFLPGVKTVQILQFARHDLKKKFLSAPTITKLKIWKRQILSRFLDGPNKFCQSSASGPLINKLRKLAAHVGKHLRKYQRRIMTSISWTLHDWSREGKANFVSLESRETFRFEGNKIHCVPRDQSFTMAHKGHVAN